MSGFLLQANAVLADTFYPKRNGGTAAYYQSPVNTESNDIYIGWDTDGKTLYQVRYCTRHRIMFDGDSEPTYTSWSAWTNLYTSTTPTTRTKLGSYFGYATKLSLSSTDFTGSYDQLQVMIQTRTCNSNASTYGAWDESIVSISYVPEWSWVSETLDFETGEILLTIDPNFARAVSNLWLSMVYPSGSPAWATLAMDHRQVNDYTYLANGNVTLRVPSEIADKMPRSGADLSLGITTCDGVIYYRKKAYTISTDSPTPAHIKEPDETITPQTYGLDVSVKHESSSGAYVEYESVSISYSWTDSRGEYVSETLPLVKNGANWEGVIPAPPFGSTVSYTVTATGTYSGVTIFNVTTGSETIAASKWFVLSDSEDVVWLGYELSFNRSIDNNVTVTRLASGRSIARHGAGAEGKITISGTILDSTRRGSLSSIWLPDAQTLDDPHDWVLRTPEGDRYKVCVESWSLGASRNGIQQLAIDMQEVG